MDYIDINSEKRFNKTDLLYEAMKKGLVEDNNIADVTGCIHRIRVMSGFFFIILRTSRHLLQCIFEPDKADFDIESIKEGDFVTFTGKCIKEERSKIGYDFNIISCRIISAPETELPFVINKKELDIGYDMMLDYRPISLRNPKERAIIKLSEGVARGFREYFLANGYTEFSTPQVVSAGAEGGADMFGLDYFGRPAYLAQSPQVYKQMMVGAFERVFTMGKVFRAEKSHTSRHITEFQGIDMEMGYIDGFEDVMLEESRALAHTFELLRTEYAEELALVRVELPEFKTIPVVKFMDIKEIIAKKFKRQYRSADDLEPEEERLIGEYMRKKYDSQLVFVTHYPSSKRPFYTMDDPEDPHYTCSFDLLLNGAEVTTGSQRIHIYSEQVAKMERLGMDIGAFEDYLMIHKYGMPPHGGLGIGLERLTMKLLKLDNIRSATAFPRDVDRLTP